MEISSIPHSPLPSRGQWPQSFLDDIHLWLANVGGQPTFANTLINGGFDIWQRGTTFTTSGYTADRWLLTIGAGATVTVDRVANDTGGYRLRFTRTVAGAASSFLSQRIERLQRFAVGGAGVADSIAASVVFTNATVGAVVTFKAVQCFGTGGAPSGNVTTTLGSYTFTGAAVPNDCFSGVFTLPSIEGKTFGTNGDDYLEFQIELPTTSGTPSFRIESADVRASPSAAPLMFTRLPLDVTLAQCERYYQKSYDLADVAGTVTVAGMVMTRAGAANVTLGMPGGFRVRMRTTPTLTIYSPVTGTANRVSNLTGPADIVVNTTAANQTTWGTITLAAAPAAVDMIRMQWVADAEL